MYQVQEYPDIAATLDNGVDFRPLITLKSDSGAKAHIFEDDHCYVLAHSAARTDGRVSISAWWFAEAFEAARSLPPLTPP